MTMFESIDFIPILQIIWIDLLLSGDNAVVIALACRGLPEKQKRIGLIFGVSTAIILRILFYKVLCQLIGCINRRWKLIARLAERICQRS